MGITMSRSLGNDGQDASDRAKDRPVHWALEAFPSSSRGTNLPSRVNQVAVEGLRTTDPASLSVLTQDLLRQPLGRVAPETLADLFALSEASEQLPHSLHRDIGAFCQQKVREMEDLAGGQPMLEFLSGFLTVPGGLVPYSLREAIGGLDEGDNLSNEAAEALNALHQRWEGVHPDQITLPKRPTQSIEHPTPPERLRVPDPIEKPKIAAKASPRPKPSRTPAAQKDQRRSDWIREDILQRLDEYGERGLKEAVIVAGTLHRSPYKDLTETEIMAELRGLKRESQVSFSAGRWSRRRGMSLPRMS
jgi:hypothetical protein